jgi:phosphoribosylformylglycinamidine (FGAM) synthase-like enzyme
VNKSDKDAVVDSFEKDNIQAEQIGRVTDSGKIVTSYKRKKILLK